MYNIEKNYHVRIEVTDSDHSFIRDYTIHSSLKSLGLCLHEPNIVISCKI